MADSASASGLSDLAIRLAKWIVAQCPDGRGDHVDLPAMTVAFADIPEKELAEAIAELGMDGYVSTNQTPGERLAHIRPELDLYVSFDPVAGIGDPMSDARELIAQILAGEDAVNVAQLHAQTGWSLRRFNPAIGLVTSQIDPQRLSRTIDQQYATRFFHLMPEDRVALKRFIKIP